MGETSIPKNAIEYLRKIGVKTLIQHVDNDAAGLQGAIKWRDLLHDTEFEHYPMSWGLDAKTGYDSNDAYIDSGFNADVFRTRLDNLKPLRLPAHEKLVKHNYNDADFEKTPQGLIDANISALGVRSWKANGYSNNVSSPFRDDGRKPSFGIRRDNGVGKDFGGTGETYSPWQIAEALGIDPRAYNTKREKRSKNRVNTGLNNVPEQVAKKPVIFEPRFIDTEQFYDSRGLPSLHIAAISLACHGKSDVAIIADALIRATASGLLPVTGSESGVSIKEIQAITGYTRKTLAPALQKLESLLIVKLIANVPETTPNKRVKELAEDSGTKGSKPVRGASKYYQVNLSKDSTSAVLDALLARYTKQKFKGKDVPAPLNDLMAAQIGLNEDVFNAHTEVHNATIDTEKVKPILSAIKKEMSGDGKDWKGWNIVLTDSKCDTYMDEMPKTMGAWRVNTFLRLSKINNQRQLKDWKRFLGASTKDAVRTAREKADHKSIVQRPRSDVKQITSDDRTDPEHLKTVVMNELSHASKELQGRAISANLQVNNSSEPINVSLFNGNYMDIVEKYRNVLTGISFIVQTASKYVPLTADEIATIAQNKANKQAEKEANINTVEPDETPVIQDEKESVLSHPVTEYDPDFIRQSVSRLYEMVTGHYPPVFATSKEIVLSTIAHYEAKKDPLIEEMLLLGGVLREETIA